MADTVTRDLLSREAPKTSLWTLPTEMLCSIFSYSDLVTLMRLSTTCSALRYHVHELFASRISDQAKKYPEVKESLDRIGWKKKHDFWNCKCFQMMGGPTSTWSELGEDGRVSAVCNSDLSQTSTTVAGKTFFVKYKEIRYKQIASGGSLQTLTSFNNLGSNFALASYDNVLAIRFTRNVERICSIFNASTLVEVCELDLGYNHDDVWVADKGIVLTRDTMVVCLDHYQENGDPKTMFQIWNLNTQDPQAENISFLYTLSHDTAHLLNRVRLFSRRRFCVSDQFVVIFDGVVKVFGRSEDNPLVSQVDIGNMTPKAIAIQSGEGDHIAVALESFGPVPKLTVKVLSASRGEMIVEKEIDMDFSRIPQPYIKWFGDHLIIGCQQGNSLAFFSWQPELDGFLSTPCQVPVVRRSPRGNRGKPTMCRAICLHSDFQGLTTAVYSRCGWIPETMVHFKSWKSLS